MNQKYLLLEISSFPRSVAWFLIFDTPTGDKLDKLGGLEKYPMKTIFLLDFLRFLSDPIPNLLDKYQTGVISIPQEPLRRENSSEINVPGPDKKHLKLSTHNSKKQKS